MSKPLPPLPRKPRARQRSIANEESTAPVTTYSIRLPEKDRRILEEALDVTGWTPTHFITRATLERAAQIVNTRTPRKFDFDRLARSLAKQLCEPGFMGYRRDDETLVDLEDMMAEGISKFVTDPPSLRAPDVEVLARAWRSGGAEFFGKIVEECRRLVVDRSSLPEPIDPTTGT